MPTHARVDVLLIPDWPGKDLGAFVRLYGTPSGRTAEDWAHRRARTHAAQCGCDYRIHGFGVVDQNPLLTTG